MSRDTLRGGTAITGIGWTAQTKRSGRSALALATEAGLAAAHDAGIDPTEIDGLITYYWGQRDTPAPPELAHSLGLTSCRLSLCDAGGGAWACSAIAVAALAVHGGLCRHVLVYRAANSRSEPPRAGFDPWPSGQRQWSEPFGATHAATLYGPAVSAWMAHYGIANADFAPMAVQQRGNATVNRKALMTTAISEADHQASPWVVEPFRLLDCAPVHDGGMAVLVSATADARRMRQSVVTVRAAVGGTLGAPVTSRVRGRRWELNALDAAAAVYEAAGVTAADLDLAQVYDPFTGMALLHIEQFDLAPAGGSARHVREGQLGLDGRLPVNTHGGNLSEGNTAGLGHVVEAVQQLREGGVRDDLCDGEHDHDRSRCRQVREPGLALVAAESGDSALILGRAA